MSTPSPAGGGPRDALTTLLPVVPVTRRVFSATEQVLAFLSVYQGGRTAPGPVRITTRVIDTQDTTVVTAVDTLPAERFAPGVRSADVRYVLPLSQLTPGEYLLTIDAALGTTTSRRDVRFRVK